MRHVCLAFAVLAALPIATADAVLRFQDASSTLPAKPGRGYSMDASAVDIDADGDLDLVIAMEFQENRMLLNNGQGRFTDASDQLPRNPRDSEEVSVVDVDGDRDLDIAVANEDDLLPELYLNTGNARFRDSSKALRVRVKANAVVAKDLDDDGDVDLFFGGDRVSVLMLNDGRGRFKDMSYTNLPPRLGANQDVAAGDIDADGDVDLVLANEDGNQVYLNDGRAFFTLGAQAHLPRPTTPEESRDAELFDADGDGDLDIYFANVRLWNQQAGLQSRLLLNDGAGVFSDVTKIWLPQRDEQTMSASPIDFDADGRMDLLLTTLTIGPGGIGPGPIRALRNTGARLDDVTATMLPSAPTAAGFDIAPGDFDGDGVIDLFIASRGGADLILHGVGRKMDR